MWLPRLYIIMMVFFKCSMSYDLPEVETPLGKIIGSWQQSLDGRRYAAYEGIPYAKPPVADLRFEEPQPVEPWVDILNATITYTCPQASFLGEPETTGDEDCLYLNVYRPVEYVNSSKQLDVLVAIHGGAFMVASGHIMFNSKVFMDRDMILVSINYRLGILGFLSTEDDVIPGNNGLKDQVLALQWVKDNIASFGGNPKSVTIAGLSAGGASVHLHYFSPLSKGLFVRGLAQSGTVLDPWVIKERPLESARKLVVLVGCDDGSSALLKMCLKGKPVASFLDNLKYFYGYHGIMPFSPFAPVVERNSKKPFLAKHPYLLLKEGKVLDVPLVTSTTADEGLLPTALYHGDLIKIEEEWSENAHHLLDYNYTLPVSKRNDIARKIKKFYLGPGERINEKNFKLFTQIFTDRLFVVGGELAARLQAKATKSPVYYYHFNYKEGENKGVHMLVPGKDIEGACHGEDAIYFYGFLLYKELSEKDLRLKNACQDMLYSYVTTGVPSFDGTDQWKPTTDPSALTYLNVTSPDDIKLEKRESLSPIKFWKDLGLSDEDVAINIKTEL